MISANKNNIFLSCCLLTGLVYLCADIYIPSISGLALLLDCSINQIQQGIALLMLGLSLSQLIYGPLSEGYGRKHTLLTGLSICLVGALISYASIFIKNIHLFYFGQLLEGLGLGSTALFRAMLRDSFEGHNLRNKSNFISMFTSISAPLTQMIGGFLEVYTGTKSVFFVLNLIIVIILIHNLYTVPETNPQANINKVNTQYIIDIYKLIMKHSLFRGYCFCTLLTYCSYFAIMLIIPVFATNHLNWREDMVGLAMLINGGAGMVSGGLVNKALCYRYDTNTIMKVGWTIMTIAATYLLIHDLFFPTSASVAFGVMAVFLFGTCFLYANYFIKAFEPFNESAGYASSLFACAQIFGSVIAAFVSGLLPESNLIPLSLLLLICTIITWLYHEIIILPRTQPFIDKLDSQND
ncbi:MAG: MFS transporter [Pseudomonadota bacterium]|nr:MFS transporter [Pseudomonadota bacterium]